MLKKYLSAQDNSGGQQTSLTKSNPTFKKTEYELTHPEIVIL